MGAKQKCTTKNRRSTGIQAYSIQLTRGRSAATPFSTVSNVPWPSPDQARLIANPDSKSENVEGKLVKFFTFFRIYGAYWIRVRRCPSLFSNPCATIAPKFVGRNLGSEVIFTVDLIPNLF
jgi:hypothetical protein